MFYLTCMNLKIKKQLFILFTSRLLRGVLTQKNEKVKTRFKSFGENFSSTNAQKDWKQKFPNVKRFLKLDNDSKFSSSSLR